MQTVRDDALAYARCGCGAMWFDGTTLAEYARRYEDRKLDLEALVVEPDADGLHVACPRCGTAELVPARVDAIRVRSCRSCRGCLVPHESDFAAREPERSGSSCLTAMNFLHALFGGGPN